LKLRVCFCASTIVNSFKTSIGTFQKVGLHQGKLARPVGNPRAGRGGGVRRLIPNMCEAQGKSTSGHLPPISPKFKSHKVSKQTVK